MSICVSCEAIIAPKMELVNTFLKNNLKNISKIGKSFQKPLYKPDKM